MQLCLVHSAKNVALIKSTFVSAPGQFVSRALQIPICICICISKVKVTRLINAEIESASPTNFKLGRRLEHALSTVMASCKGL